MSSPLTASNGGETLLAWAAARQASTAPALVDLTLPPARIELSGRVLVNWWAKNAGLLQSEWGAGPGFRIALDVPVHWRTLPLALAALSLGTTLGDASLPDPDLVVTLDPAAALDAGAPEALAITTAALAIDFGAPLPAGAIDHAGEVRAQPDRLVASAQEASRAGWEHDGGVLSLTDLLAPQPGAGAEAALWLGARAGFPAAMNALITLGRAGSLVLTDEAGPSEAVAAQERIAGPAPVLPLG